LVGIAYRSDDALGLTVIVWDGHISIEDWRSHFGQMTADPSWPIGRLGLLDATSVDVSALTPDDMRQVAGAFRGHRSKIAGIKYAIVAGDAAYAYALAFQEASGPTGLVAVVFSDLDIACDWLGVSVEDVEPTIEALRVEIRSR
jgi:hypothetical protein